MAIPESITTDVYSSWLIADLLPFLLRCLPKSLVSPSNRHSIQFQPQLRSCYRKMKLMFFQCVVAHWIEKRIRNMEILEKVGIEQVRLFFGFLPPGRYSFQSNWPGKALLLCRTFQAACSTSSDDRLHYTPQTFAKKIVLQADINKTSESVYTLKKSLE